MTIKSLTIILATAFAITNFAYATTNDICGQMVYRAGWTGEDRGFYVLPHNSGENFTLLGKTRFGLENGAYFDPETSTIRGAYATISNNTVSSVYILSYDSDTWEEKSCVQLDADRGVPMMATSVALDPSTGDVYGYFYSEDGSSAVWAKADYASCSRTPLASMSLNDACPALAATPDGIFYGIDLNGALVKVNKANGRTTKIADTQLPLEYPFGACISKDGKSMFATCNTDEYGSGLYKIDLADGKTTLVADFGADIQVMNLYLRPGADSPLSPAAPAFSVQPDGGALSAGYSITLPTKTDSGAALEGTLDWRITRGGKSVAYGKAKAGETVSGTLTVETDGIADFYAFAENDEGKSARTRVTVFVGTDSPAAPQNVRLTYSEGTMTLTWDAVSTPANGGYMESDKISYTVRRQGEIKASGLKSTQWSEHIGNPENRETYIYTVEAVCEGRASATTPSNEIMLGSYSAPFSTIFNSTSTFATYGYTVDDVNADRKTWTSTTKGARYQFNKNQSADDWLFTPAIYLEKGKAYELTLQVFANSAESPETFEVKAGREATVAAMTNTVIERTTTKAVVDAPETVAGYVIADADGPWHIGIHAVSEPNMWYLFVKELHLSGAVDGTTPMMVGNLTAIPDASGSLKVEIGFTAPAGTVGGTPLTDAVAVLTRNGKEIARKTVTSSEATAFTDTPAARGEYEYGVHIIAGGTAGRMKTVKVFVGPYAAAAPVEATVTETEPGVVRVTWTPVTEDINGSPLDAANILYMVYGTNDDGSAKAMLEAPTAATEASFRAMGTDDPQQFIYYAVSAFNRGAESAYALTNIIPVGKAYLPPVVYSNARSLDNFRLAIDKSGGASWSFMADEDGVLSADGDGQYFASNCYVANRYGDLLTGKIALGASPCEAELSFHTYRHDENDKNTVEASVICGETETPLVTADHNEMKAGQWNLVKASLADFAGKEIQIRIRSYHISNAYTLVDAISITEKGGTGAVSDVIIERQPVTEYFDLKGRKLTHAQKGVLIISSKNGDGSTEIRKVLIK